MIFWMRLKGTRMALKSVWRSNLTTKDRQACAHKLSKSLRRGQTLKPQGSGGRWRGEQNWTGLNCINPFHPDSRMIFLRFFENLNLLRPVCKFSIRLIYKKNRQSNLESFENDKFIHFKNKLGAIFGPVGRNGLRQGCSSPPLFREISVLAVSWQTLKIKKSGFPMYYQEKQSGGRG